MAVISQVILLLYFQIVEWVPMPPWNDLEGGNSQATLDIVLGLVQVALIFLTVKRSVWGRRLGISVYGVWFGLQLLNWWVAYLFGTPEEAYRLYLEHFANTHKFLPSIGDNLVPDSNHVVLHLLLLWVLISLARRPHGLARSAEGRELTLGLKWS